MIVVIDTNVLGRLAEPGHPQHQVADDALRVLGTQGNTPCAVPQTFYEFWVVATRPVAQNGLGFTAPQAEAELSRLESLFSLLPDSDAMTIHRVTHILTFNSADYTRYPGIVVLDPAVLAAPPTP